jgi:acyl-CoA thioester hydrolase
VRLHETRVELEVPFSDVDSLRVVWHGRYYEYFERARTALLRSIRLDVSDLMALRYRFLVVESHCRHIHSLEYAERFEVSAWLRDVSNRLCVDYEITSLDHDRRSAKGHTVLVSTDLDGKLLLRTPQVIRERIGE